MAPFEGDSFKVVATARGALSRGGGATAGGCNMFDFAPRTQDWVVPRGTPNARRSLLMLAAQTPGKLF